MSAVRFLFGILGMGATGLIAVLLGFLLLAVKIAVICGVIYAFLAAGGFVPPLDVVPIVPYV